MIYKKASPILALTAPSEAGEELYNSMLNNESTMAFEADTEEQQKLVSALENLTVAADCFESIGLVKEASDITAVLLSFAKKKQEKKKVVKKKDKKDETQEVFKMFGFNNKK